ncbi:hypothetical protein C900_01412 [Fulvivirga imtechensis AK7]|uniref:Uncharacterized protein n=1 Tax=Fulvivirga imtechensis AK7 TaxID=1237149 RepID=L8K2W9_9BACT|nr:hypothetical protein [Fulvivirga imtechensis]ELR73802.1 hypothetical protein C900_01412 [Fulvivirga imtechensis AK7]
MRTWLQLFKLLILAVSGVSFFSNLYSQNDSLYAALNNAQHDTVRVQTLVALSKSLTISRDEGQQRAREALAISRQIDYTFGIGLSCYALLDFVRDADDINYYATTALEAFEKAGNSHYKAQTLISTAYTYLDIKANYTMALRYARQSMAIDQNSEPDLYLRARGWNLMGEIYRITRNYDRALEAYAKASDYAQKAPVIYTSPFINTGTVYKDKGRYDLALNKYDSVLTYLISKNLKISSTFAYIQNRKAQVHLLNNNFNKALEEAGKGLEVYNILNFTRGIIMTLSTISEAHYHLGYMDECIANGIKAIEMASIEGVTTEGIERVARIVAEAYASKGDNANAYHYHKIYSDLHNTIYAPESYIELANQQITLETENQELEKQLLEEQAKASAIVIHNQRRFNLIIIMALILLSVLSFFLFRNMKAKSRLNYTLKEQQDEILQQSEELKAQAEELQTYNEKIKTVNATLEDLVLERTQKIQQQNKRLMEYAFLNAHNVRGPLARILGLVYLMDKELPNDGYKSYKNMLKEAGQELDQVISEIKKKLENE